MTASTPTENEAIFRPRRLMVGIGGLVVIAVGLLIASPLWTFSLPRFNDAIWSRPLFVVALIIAAAGEVYLLGLGILTIAGTFRGLPSLTVTPRGISLKTVFRTRWADQGSLAPFELATRQQGFPRTVIVATSRIVGTGVSRNLLRRKKLTIPDHFRTPIGAIVANLKACHARAAGVSQAHYPDAAVAMAAREARFGVAGFKLPWLTFAIFAVLVAVFACEQIFAVAPAVGVFSPSVATLEALGGLDKTGVLATGEWYRLFTAPLLHAGILHLVNNDVALLLVGFVLEKSWLGAPGSSPSS
jgi:hypothetical protein